VIVRLCSVDKYLLLVRYQLASSSSYSMQGMVNTFAENQQVWNGTVAAMSELDALMSLAAFAEHSSAWGPICRPLFVEPDAYGSQVSSPPLLELSVYDSCGKV
jgi:DNA mismatch repair ATPase MutS